MQPVINENVSSNYYDFYDHFNKISGRDYYKRSGTPNKEFKFISNEQLSQELLKPLSLSRYLRERHSNDFTRGTDGFTGSHAKITSITLPSTVFQSPSFPRINDEEPIVIRPQNKSILAIIKLGMIEVKSIGIVKFLVVLLSKLKLFIITVFFKILFLFKLIKFNKILMLRLLLRSLFPAISTAMVNSINNIGASQLISQSDGLLGNILANILEIGSSGTPPYIISSQIDDNHLRGRSNAGRLFPELFNARDILLGELTETIIPTRYSTDDYEFDNSHFSDSLLDRTLKLLVMIRKFLKPKNYVKKMACRIILQKKSHMLLIWINR